MSGTSQAPRLLAPDIDNDDHDVDSDGDDHDNDVKGQDVDGHDDGVKGHDHDYERRNFKQSHMRIMMNFEFHSSLSLFNLKLYLSNFDIHIVDKRNENCNIFSILHLLIQNFVVVTESNNQMKDAGLQLSEIQIEVNKCKLHSHTFFQSQIIALPCHSVIKFSC